MSKLYNSLRSSAAMALIVLGSIAGNAHAQGTWSPSGTYNFATAPGSPVVVNKGTPFPCALNVEIYVANEDGDGHATPWDHGHNPVLVSATFSQWAGFPVPQCDEIVVDVVDSAITVDSAGNLTVADVYVHTPTFGDCQGSITGSLGSSPSTTLSLNTFLPEVVAGTNNCTVAGNLSIVLPVGGSVSF